MKNRLGFLEERILPFLDPSLMGPPSLYLCNCNTGEGIPTFQGLLDIGSELILIPGKPKYHYGLSVEG